jgi:drug/metabolite transporter (DMT)-like permease
MKKFTAEGALILTTIIWGGTFVIIKTALDDISPMMFISLRFTLASILLLPLLFKTFHLFNKDFLKNALWLSFLFFAGFATQNIGLKYTTATKSAFITGTFVIFTPLFQLLIEKRMPRKGTLIGVALVITGLILLSSRGDTLFQIFTEIGSNFNFGDFLTLICALFFALYIVYLDIISKKFDYKPLVFSQISFTAAAGFFTVFLFSSLNIEPMEINFSANVIIAIAYTAILATIVTTTLQTKYQKILTPSKAGIILSFEPIFAALFAYILLSETLTLFGFIGGIFIFGGLIASELIDKNKVE